MGRGYPTTAQMFADVVGTVGAEVTPSTVHAMILAKYGRNVPMGTVYNYCNTMRRTGAPVRPVAERGTITPEAAATAAAGNAIPAARPGIQPAYPVPAAALLTATEPAPENGTDVPRRPAYHLEDMHTVRAIVASVGAKRFAALADQFAGLLDHLTAGDVVSLAQSMELVPAAPVLRPKVAT